MSVIDELYSSHLVLWIASELIYLSLVIILNEMLKQF